MATDVSPSATAENVIRGFSFETSENPSEVLVRGILR
jgi:hypothetical protein